MRAGVLVLGIVIATLARPAALPGAVALAAGPCDTGFAPTTTVYLPNITKTLGGPTGWVTPFIVQNVGFFATTLEVSFYRFSDGALVTCRKISQLQPSRSFADVPNNDLDLPDDSQFAVVVRSFGSEIVAVVNEQAGFGDRAEALSYDGLSSGVKAVALPYVAASAGGWISRMIIQNLGPTVATVTAAFTSFDGTQTATIARTMSPGRSSFIDPGIESALRPGVEYSAMLTSSAPIGVVVNSHNDTPDVVHPRAFAYNGVPVGVVGFFEYTFMPLVSRNTEGLGRTSRLITQNTSSVAATPHIDLARFSDGAGVTMSPATALAPGHVWSFDVSHKADDQTPCPASGATDCISEGEHGGTVTSGRFAALDIVLSPTTAMAYASMPASPSRVFLPNVTRALGGPSGWTTPIIIQRPSYGPATVSVRWYRFSDGRLVTQQVVSGLRQGASVRIDPRFVPALADGTQYAVVVDGSGPISAIVEELNFSGGANAMIYPGFASLVQPISVPTVMTGSPSAATVPIGGTQQYSVTVTDQFGSPASRTAWPVTWSVSPTSLGTITAGGLFTARGYGSGKVVASAGAASAAVALTVLSPPGHPTVDVPVGYSYQTVSTSVGTFGAHVVKERLAAVSIRAATANDADCLADCPAQPLLDYLNQSGAFAGINGSYFCPPDYPACDGVVNSYDYPVYSSQLGHWLNENNLVSPTNSLLTVSGKTLRFYQHTYDYDHSAVDAAISNFPMLLQGGQRIDSAAIQTDKQKLAGTKGSIGTDGTYVYLVLVSGATMNDFAFVLQALGETDAMNLDGGGSSALFVDGVYKAGPGRLLPNVVMLTAP